MRTLAAKGLVPKTEEYLLELSYIEVEGELGEISVRILQAKLGRSEAEQLIVSLQTQRANEVATLIVENQQRLSHTTVRLDAVAQRLAVMSRSMSGRAGDIAA